MSALKRSRQAQHTEAQAVSPQHPGNKRLKTHTGKPAQARHDFSFLVDEDARNTTKLEARLTNGVPSSHTTRVDESRAVLAPDTNDVSNGEEEGGSPENAIGISSDEDSSEEDESEDDEEEEESPIVNGANTQPSLNNGEHSMKDDVAGPDAALSASSKMDLVEAEAEHSPEDELEAPSFGELLQAQHPDPVDVQALFPNPMADRQALVPSTGNRAVSAPTGTTLTTVLTQALKTNDKDLLESCFQTNDLPSIRSTIQRLQSHNVATLLQRLAERIHRRPGRTGSLLVWIQWSIIAHGGYLASQPAIMAQLRSLSQVIQQRANGLQPLLHLKGKLDMLSAQLELRRNIQAASRAANAWDEDDDEEGVVYVEGQDDDWSDADGEAAVATATIESGIKAGPSSSKSKRQTATPPSDQSDSSDDGEDDDDDDDLPNGVMQAGGDQSSADEGGDAGMFDLEADETSDDEGDDLDEENSDEDAESDVESEDDLEPSDNESNGSGVQAPMPKTLNRKR